MATSVAQPVKITINAPNLQAQPKRRLIKTALHQAVLDERLRQVRILVSKYNVNVDSKDLYGRTCLMLTCLIENENIGYRMTKLLLQAGAFIGIRDHLGRTALSYACMKDRYLIAKKLLKEDVLGVNEPDNDGNTPLHHAAMNGNPFLLKLVVDVLLRFGLPMDTKNSMGYTPLLLACKHGYFSAAYVLLSQGVCSPMIRDNELFMNALEWTKRHRSIPSEHFVLRRSYTQPSLMPSDCLSLSRENTLGSMYQKQMTRICKHTRLPPDPFSVSTERFILPSVPDAYLPPVQSAPPAMGVKRQIKTADTLSDDEHEPVPIVVQEDEEEPIILDENIAKEKLLNRLIEFETEKGDDSTPAKSQFRKSRPQTSKLLAIANRGKSAPSHTMRTIFKIYADQRGVPLPRSQTSVNE